MKFDWDAWRRRYPTTSFADEQEFCAQVATAYPNQRCFNPGLVLRFLIETNAEDITEVGGWDGELAHDLLPLLPRVRVWRNLELCPVLEAKCADPRYTHEVLDDWPWNRDLPGDTLILSHVAEHMTGGQLARVLDRFTGANLYLDVPVENEPPCWDGYTGTHILEWGWTQLMALCKTHGFRHLSGNQQIRTFKRG